MSDARVTLRDVAGAAGVSAMTVSRVLRGDPRVAPATRAKVRAAVKRTDYHPDPRWARIMELVRGGKRPRQQATIAVIREDLPEDGLLRPSYQYVAVEDIRARAHGYGYDVEEFFLGRAGMTPKKLGRVLQARGIEGVIVSPQSLRLPCAEVDYGPFASVTFGYAMSSPALHICGGNVMLGMQQAADRLTALGYRRIGVAVTRWIVGRSQYAYTGGLFHFQQSLPAADRVPFLELPHDIDSGREAFREWVRAHRPDLVISFDTHAPGWLRGMGLRIPEDVGFVSHDWTPRMRGLAGLNHRRSEVAAAAVDLVVAQISQFERGVPAVPRQILIAAEWVPGDSVRKSAP